MAKQEGDCGDKHVTLFVKCDRYKQQWALREYDEEDEPIVLVTVAFEISLQDLYNKVQFELVESEAESADIEG